MLIFKKKLNKTHQNLKYSVYRVGYKQLFENKIHFYEINSTPIRQWLPLCEVSFAK